MLKPNTNLPKEGVDFNLLPAPGDDQAYAIRVLSGPFEGVLYQYFAVNVAEQDGEGVLNYSFDVVEGTIPDTAQDDFNQLTADVLHAIINDFLDNNPESIEYKEEDGQEPRDDNPSSPSEV